MREAILCLLLIAVPATAQDAKQLAADAKKVFATHCYRCHGQAGAAEGGFNNVTDLKALVGGRVVAGDPAKSRLFKRMGVAKDMPPEDETPRPSDVEIEAVKKWIAAGAPEAAVVETAKRAFVSLTDEYEAMNRFLRKADKADRVYIRFFTLRPLYNMPADQVNEADLRVYRAALAKLINSLSWKKEIVVPTSVDAAGTLYAIDTRKLDWADNDHRKDLWREMLKLYPYGLKHDKYPEDRALNEAAADVYYLTDSHVPVVRADWFIATASRPPLYHELLQIPKHAKDLEYRLGVDAAKNIQHAQVKRAGFNASGVSGQNRMVERHDALFGAYWKSYDFKSSAGDGNIFVLPLGPKFDGNHFDKQAFKHDGGESIFNLPNGLQGYMLVDGKDNRINEGPIEVVSDGKRVSGTAAVVNGISCMACHRHGMIGLKDQIREGHILGGNARDFVRQIFPEPKEMDEVLKKDEKRFLDAYDAAAGTFLRVSDEDKKRDIRDFPEPLTAIARWYISQEMTSATAARELGLDDAKRLEGAIAANPQLQVNGLFPLSRGNTIKREVWEHQQYLESPFQVAAFELKLGTPVIVR